MKPTEKRIFIFVRERRKDTAKKDTDRDRETERRISRSRKLDPPSPRHLSRALGEKALFFSSRGVEECIHHVEKRVERRKDRERERKRETAKTRTNKVPEHTSAIKGTASPASLLGTSRDKPKPSPPRRKKRDFDEHRIRYTINCRRRYFLGDF